MKLADSQSATESIWQWVESCAYLADLSVWSEVTAGSASVLDLGCGIGRVSRHLAAEGRSVLGVDLDPVMIADLNRLAVEQQHAAIPGDVTDLARLDLGRDRFETIIAPQQLIHILGGHARRQQLLDGVKRRLKPGGTFAFAISELVLPQTQELEILPDLRELDGWVYASRPVAVEADGETLTIVRLRQVVAPDGSLEENRDSITLDLIDRESIAEELHLAGLYPARLIEIPETERHIASLVVLARHSADIS